MQTKSPTLKFYLQQLPFYEAPPVFNIICPERKKKINKKQNQISKDFKIRLQL